MRFHDYIDWMQTKGKLWGFRFSILALIAWSILSKLGIFMPKNPQISLIILAIPAMLWVMLEIILRAFTDAAQAPEPDAVVNDWNDLARTLSEKAAKSTRIDMMASSSESFYVMLKDKILTSREKQIRILIREWDDNRVERYYKLQNYQNYWLSLNDDARDINITIKYCRNYTLRAIFFDDDECFIGFYTWQSLGFQGKEGLRAQNVPALHYLKQSQVGLYLMQVFRNRFDHYWDIGTSLPPPPDVAD